MSEEDGVLSVAVETVEIEEDICVFQLEVKLKKKTKQPVIKQSNSFSLDLSAGGEPKEQKRPLIENITPPPQAPIPSTSGISLPTPPKGADANFQEYQKLIGESPQPRGAEAASLPLSIPPIVFSRTR